MDKFEEFLQANALPEGESVKQQDQFGDFLNSSALPDGAKVTPPRDPFEDFLAKNAIPDGTRIGPPPEAAGVVPWTQDGQGLQQTPSQKENPYVFPDVPQPKAESLSMGEKWKRDFLVTAVPMFTDTALFSMGNATGQPSGAPGVPGYFSGMNEPGGPTDYATSHLFPGAEKFRKDAFVASRQAYDENAGALIRWTDKFIKEHEYEGGQGWGQDFRRGAVSLGTFMAPSVVIGIFAGPGAAEKAMALGESANEAGAVERELVTQYGFKPSDAHDAATVVFAANVMLNGYLDSGQLGFLDSDGLLQHIASAKGKKAFVKMVAKYMAKNWAKEGVQETGQEFISMAGKGQFRELLQPKTYWDRSRGGPQGPLRSGVIGSTLGFAGGSFVAPGAGVAYRNYVGDQLAAGLEEGPLGSRPQFSPVFSNRFEEQRILGEMENDPATNPRLARRLARTAAEQETAEIDQNPSTHGATSTAATASPAPATSEEEDLGDGWKRIPGPKFSEGDGPEEQGDGQPRFSRSRTSQLTQATGVPLTALSSQALYAYWDVLEMGHELGGSMYRAITGEATDQDKALEAEAARVMQVLFKRREGSPNLSPIDPDTVHPQYSQDVYRAATAFVTRQMHGTLAEGDEIDTQEPYNDPRIAQFFGVGQSAAPQLDEGPSFSREARKESQPGQPLDWREPGRMTLRGLKVLSEEMPEKFTADQFLQMLLARGVKAEELDRVWSDFLAMNANGELTRDANGKWVWTSQDKVKIERADAIAWARVYLKLHERFRKNANGGFMRYTEHGNQSENYQEVVELRPANSAKDYPYAAPAHEPLGMDNLAHSRMVDAVDDNENLVLMSEEGQSDLHQNARDYGYMPRSGTQTKLPPSSPWVDMMLEWSRNAYDPRSGHTIVGVLSDDEARIMGYDREAAARRSAKRMGFEVQFFPNGMIDTSNLPREDARRAWKMWDNTIRRAREINPYRRTENYYANHGISKYTAISTQLLLVVSSRARDIALDFANDRKVSPGDSFDAAIGQASDLYHRLITMFLSGQAETVSPTEDFGSDYAFVGLGTYLHNVALACFDLARGSVSGRALDNPDLFSSTDAALIRAMADWYAASKGSTAQRKVARIGERVRPKETGVPNEAHQDSWPQRLATRHVLEAVNRGIDQVGWTSGREQAIRWQDQTRKAVDRVEWSKSPDGSTILVTAFAKGYSHRGDTFEFKYDPRLDAYFYEKYNSNTGQYDPWPMHAAFGKPLAEEILASDKGSKDMTDFVMGEGGFVQAYDSRYTKEMQKLGGKDAVIEKAQLHQAINNNSTSALNVELPDNWHPVPPTHGQATYERDVVGNNGDVWKVVDAVVGSQEPMFEIYLNDVHQDEFGLHGLEDAVEKIEMVYARPGWTVEKFGPGGDVFHQAMADDGSGTELRVTWGNDWHPDLPQDDWYATPFAKQHTATGVSYDAVVGDILGPFDEVEGAMEAAEQYLRNKGQWHLEPPAYPDFKYTPKSPNAYSKGAPRRFESYRMGIPQDLKDRALAGELFLFKRDLDGTLEDNWDEFFRRQKPVKPSTIAQKLAYKFGKILGMDIVFIDAAEAAGFHGAFLGNVKGYGKRTVIINAASPNLSLTIVAHEAIHYMKTVHPDLYVALHAVVQDMISTKDPRYKEFRAAQRKSYKQMGIEISDDRVMEEFIADMLGEMITDPKFWVKLASQNAVAFQTLRTSVRSMLKTLREAMGADPNALFLTQQVRDIKAVEDAMASALAEMAKRESLREVQDAEYIHDVGVARMTQVVTAINTMAPWRFGPLDVSERARYVQDGDAAKFGAPVDQTKDPVSAVARLTLEGVRTIMSLEALQTGSLDRYRQWYREHVQRYLAMIDHEIPGAATDPTTQAFVNFILAITSPGVSLETNFNHSVNVILSWLRDGKWPIIKAPARDHITGEVKLNAKGKPVMKRQLMSHDPGGRAPLVVGGKALNTVTKAFDRLMVIVNAMPGATPELKMQQAMTWLQERHTHAEFAAMFPGTFTTKDGKSKSNSWLTKNGDHLGSMIFGPKVSRYFENLQGRHDLAVFDRWFSYWAYRRIGQAIQVTENKKTGGRSVTLKESPKNKADWGVFDQAMLAIAQQMEEITGEAWGVDEVQAVLWFAEKSEFINAKLEKQAGRVGEYDVAAGKRARRLGYGEVAKAAFDRVGSARGPRDARAVGQGRAPDAGHPELGGEPGGGQSGPDAGTPSFSRTPARVAGPATEAIIKRSADRVAQLEAEAKKTWGDRWHAMRRAIFDRGGALDWRIAEALKTNGYDPKQILSHASKNPYLLLRLLSAAPSISTGFIMRGIPEVSDTDKIAHPGLNVILKKHKINTEQKHAELNVLLVANQLEDYAKKRRVRRGTTEPFVHPDALAEYLQARKEILDGEFGADLAAAAAEVASFNTAFLKWCKEMGIVSPALYLKLTDMYNRWVPIHDLGLVGPDGGVRGKHLSAAASSGVKAAYGFDVGFTPAPPLETIQRNVHYMVSAALENRVKLALAQLARKLPGVIDHVRPKMEKISMKREDAARLALETDETELSDDYLAELMGEVGLDTDDLSALRSIWRVSSYQEQGVIAYRKEGKVHYLKVDPAIYQVFYDRTTENPSELIKLLSKPTAWFRSGVTSTIGFSAVNMIRDTRQTIVFGKTLPTPIELWRGLAAAATKNDDYWNWVMAGGGNVSPVAPDEAVRRIRALNANPAAVTKYYVVHGFQALQNLASLSDAVNRIPQNLARRRALEKQNAKLPTKQAKSRLDIQLEAAFDSRQPGLDFSQGGTLTREANRLVAFLNVKMLGRSQFFVNMKERWPQVVTTAILVYTLPTIGMWLAWRDEEWYKRQPAWMKYMYHIFPMDADGRNLMLVPKGQEMAYLFASGPEAMLNAWYEKDPSSAVEWAQRYGRDWGVYPIPVVSDTDLPQILKPYYEAMVSNYDKFTDAPVVSPSLQQVKGQYQFNASTPELTVWLSETQPGKLVGLSPIKLNHMINGYFGTWGKTATNFVSDVMGAMDPSRRRPVRSKHKLWGVVPMERTWFVNRFFRSSMAASSIYVERFDDAHWESVAAARALMTGMARNRSRPEMLRKLVEEDIENLMLFRPMNRVADAIQDVNKYVSFIESEPEGAGKFTANEKRDIRDMRTAEIDKMAKDALAERKKLIAELKSNPSYRKEQVDLILADLEESLKKIDSEIIEHKESGEWRQAR